MKKQTTAITHYGNSWFTHFANSFASYLPLLISCLLAALFGYAAYTKLAIYSTFIQQLKIVPISSSFASVIAWSVPGIEIIIAVLLLVKPTRLIGLWAAFGLMLLFTAYVFLILYKYTVEPCTCLGIIGQLSWKVHLFFNLFFTLLAMLGLFFFTRPKKSINNH